jgi:hypothetical protein
MKYDINNNNSNNRISSGSASPSKNVEDVNDGIYNAGDDKNNNDNKKNNKISRLKFLKLMACGGALVAFAPLMRWTEFFITPTSFLNSPVTYAQSEDRVPVRIQQQRQEMGKQIRMYVANKDYVKAAHPDNGEENNYIDSQGNRNFIANFSKSLPHYPTNHAKAGEVIESAYLILLDAVTNGDPREFERIPAGDSRKLLNPAAGLAFDLEGLDSHSVSVHPAPRIDSSEAAGEMAELYHMALCRDVPFMDFHTSSLVKEAVEDLTDNYEEFPVYPYPQSGHNLNAATIFRGFTVSDITGPFISQFLLKGSNDVGSTQDNDGYIKFGSLRIDQRQYTLSPDIDYLTDYNEWLDFQDGKSIRIRGGASAGNTCGNDYDVSTRRFIRNMRDLAAYVHYDDLPQPFLNACLILLHMDVLCVNPQPTFSRSNPYIERYLQRQEGFVTFGLVHILSLISEVTTRALKAVWFLKWFVHRRLRPEAFGGLIHRQLNSNSLTPTSNLSSPHPSYPIHHDILTSKVLPKIFEKNKRIQARRFGLSFGSYLLPQVYPEGSPIHPSYPAGHATVAGACVTVLKAFFDESFRIPAPVQSNREGTHLIPATNYDGSPLARPLTVGDELNKLASNIALGRNMAGIHYRSDYTHSIKLGEQIAISILNDQALTYREKFSFRFTKFDGSQVVVEN